MTADVVPDLLALPLNQLAEVEETKVARVALSVVRMATCLGIVQLVEEEEVVVRATSVERKDICPGSVLLEVVETISAGTADWLVVNYDLFLP